MMKIASHLKSCCVAIGILEEGNQLPLRVGGTGFFIDPDGFLLTASYVLKSLQKITIELTKSGHKVNFGAFWFVPIGNDEIQLQSKPITVSLIPNLDFHTDRYFGQKDVDVVVGRIEGQYQTLPFLKIKEPTKIALFQDVLTCGYPGGDLSFRLDMRSGFKTSPILQKGIVSSLMPSDITTQPVGIQTDIIATGGTSGSPIVSTHDGEVIAIGQQIIPSPVLKDGEYVGGANIGLLWGISNYVIDAAVKKTVDVLKQQVDSNGVLKSEFKNQSTTTYELKFKDGKFI